MFYIKSAVQSFFVIGFFFAEIEGTDLKIK
jgi:hypothetical protein